MSTNQTERSATKAQAHSPYQILGEEGIRKLASAFYDVMDERSDAAVIRAMHAENMEEIKQKLFEYLTGWMGGPQLYAKKYGSVCLTEAHAPYAIGEKERDEWLACMEIALERIQASDELKEMLKAPLFSVADMLRNR